MNSGRNYDNFAHVSSRIHHVERTDGMCHVLGDPLPGNLIHDLLLHDRWRPLNHCNGVTIHHPKKGRQQNCRVVILGVSENSGFYPQIIHFSRVFHYFHHQFWDATIFGNTFFLSGKIWGVSNHLRIVLPFSEADPGSLRYDVFFGASFV